MKIKPSGSGGVRTLSHSFSLSLSLFLFLLHSLTHSLIHPHTHYNVGSKQEIRGGRKGAKPIFSKGVCGGAKSDGKSVVFLCSV